MKQKSKICPGVKPPDLPLQGVESNRRQRRRGRDCEERTDGVTDREKDQKWIISNFQRLIFLQCTETFIILASAGRLRRFRGGFDSTPHIHFATTCSRTCITDCSENTLIIFYEFFYYTTHLLRILEIVQL